ncbi:hypothetical protein GOV10_05650 [Candidatus Woesearchaeota archaeon]|nr:hypothetical protein [Candidatus Woesearchaeota archaeon]
MNLSDITGKAVELAPVVAEKAKDVSVDGLMSANDFLSGASLAKLAVVLGVFVMGFLLLVWLSHALDLWEGKLRQKMVAAAGVFVVGLILFVIFWWLWAQDFAPLIRLWGGL